MITNILVLLLDIGTNLLILLIVLSAVLSYFMSPYHPVRQAVDRIIDPMLRPIRQVVPLVGMMDFSPLVLYFLVRAVSWALRNLLLSIPF